MFCTSIDMTSLIICRASHRNSNKNTTVTPYWKRSLLHVTISSGSKIWSSSALCVYTSHFLLGYFVHNKQIHPTGYPKCIPPTPLAGVFPLFLHNMKLVVDPFLYAGEHFREAAIKLFCKPVRATIRWPQLWRLGLLNVALREFGWPTCRLDCVSPWNGSEPISLFASPAPFTPPLIQHMVSGRDCLPALSAAGTPEAYLGLLYRPWSLGLLPCERTHPYLPCAMHKLSHTRRHTHAGVCARKRTPGWFLKGPQSQLNNGLINSRNE